MDKSNLGMRMKRYEEVYKYKLVPRSYTIIRLDGRAFHTFTKGLKKPFDKRVVDAMINTTFKLKSEIQGCKLAYVQSDEISLVLTDFDTHEMQPWFGNEVQKITSVSASIATSTFNAVSGIDRIANFDSRVFQVPSHTEVYNYILWRQQDAIRNSISACAQALYSPKQLNGKNQILMREMITDKSEEFTQIMLDLGYESEEYYTWEDIPDFLKYGMLIYFKNDELYAGHVSLEMFDEILIKQE